MQFASFKAGKFLFDGINGLVQIRMGVKIRDSVIDADRIFTLAAGKQQSPKKDCRKNLTVYTKALSLQEFK